MRAIREPVRAKWTAVLQLHLASKVGTQIDVNVNPNPQQDFIGFIQIIVSPHKKNGWPPT